MVKKGKDEGKGGKGKGKKEAVSESEDASDADLTKSEMGSELVEEESEEDPKQKKGKDKKGAAKAGKKGAADDAKKKKGGKAQLKGATKAMAMAKKEAAPPKKKRSLKSTSKLFMGFKGVGQKKTPKKSQFKNMSRFFWGLKTQSTKKKKKKKKNQGVLKSTSNIMMRFKGLGKRKKKKEAAAGAKKPAFMLIRLGGGKAADTKSKGGGGFFGNLFQRKKPNENFKPRAQIVSKVAATTGWLTRRFLSKRNRYAYSERVTDESWLSRIGAKKLPFPSGDEVLRHRANMRRVPGNNTLYGQTQDEFGYWDNLDSAALPDCYDDYQEDSYYDPQTSSQYGCSNYDDENYGRNPVDEEYGLGEEPVDYYEQDQYDDHNYDDQDYDLSTSYSPYQPYDDFQSGYEEPVGPPGLHYAGEEGMVYPAEDEAYAQHEVSYSEQEWPPQTQSAYNPYAYPLDDIAEMDEAERAEEEEAGYPFALSHSPFWEQQGMGGNLPSQLSVNRKFRLFPRPQVKLFGVDKIDVSLPPSPHISLACFDPVEEEEEEEELEPEALTSPFAQLGRQHQDPPRPRGTFSKLLPGFITRLQNPRSPNPRRRNLGPGPAPSKAGFSPRECGSPLGQFLQKSLSQPKPILKHRGGGTMSRPPTPSPTRTAPSSPFGGRRPMGPPSPQQATRRFEMAAFASSPKSTRQFGASGKRNIALPPSHPAAKLRDALQEELLNTLPFIGSSSYKTPQQGLGLPGRKPSQPALNHDNIQRYSSPQLAQRHNSPSSLRSFGSNRPQTDFHLPEANDSFHHSPGGHMSSQGWSTIGHESPSVKGRNPFSPGAHPPFKRIVSPTAKENPVPSWGQRPATTGNASEDASSRPPSSPRPTAHNPFASRSNLSSSSLGSVNSLRTDVPFSRSLFHVPPQYDTEEFWDSTPNTTSGRFVSTGFHNPTTSHREAPPSRQPSLRHFGPPPIPDPMQLSRRMGRSAAEAHGRLPQAWNRQPEPPTKAVKPLMREQFMRQFGHQSPVLSARNSPHLYPRQGSRRVTIRESPADLSPHAQPLMDANGSTEARWMQQQQWDYAPESRMPAPWNPSAKMGAAGSLRSISSLNQPPSPTPSARKAFLQRIGQPLAGMAQAASSTRRTLAETLGHLEDENPYRAQFGQAPGPSPGFSRRHFPQDFPSAAPSLKQMGEAAYTRSPSPKMGHKVPGGNLSYAVSGGLPGHLGRPNLSPMSQRAVSFQGPHAMGRGNPSFAGSSPFHDQYNRPRRPGSPRLPAEMLEPDMEDGMGRYAVVMPQIQRMGSSFRRRSRMQKDPWSDYHTVSVHEMPNEWGSEKLYQSPPAESFNQRPSRRGGESSVFWYLTRGSSARNKEYGGANKNWQSKMQSVQNLQSMSQGDKGVEDMTQLEDLHESVVLRNIRRRFDQGLIYTYIGSILVSVNPYKMYNIYGTDHVLQYEGKALGENPPHLFAITNIAYSKLRDAKLNQCIIISGESGSGKTEATKLILRYLAAINKKHSATQQILEATPLLESFGNAKTVRNDNSSRFGKFVEIFLEDNGLICGAITSQYLLEKSRVVFQAKNERNYHIFYEMLAGLPAQQKRKFCLQEAETYYYLNQGGNCEIPGKVDVEDFHRLLDAMEILRFSAHEQDSIFRILSSILHLGNVYFEKYETDCQEVASVVSAREIRVVAELLQISPEGLQRAITFKVTETMREKIFTPLTVDSAVDARDAIAKILYSLLFNWLTDRINKLIYPRQNTLSIAVLDIYGFEDLGFNSFEQLCINYANEYLQFFFNKIVFKEEQEEYIREQIEWKEIAFNDNQPCIDLIAQKPHGILKILDDQSSFPQATDHTFLQKCHYHHGAHLLYSKPKMPLPEFSIRHYAGKVTYQVHKFLDKNYDQVRQDVLDLFVNSKTKMVAHLFFSHAQVVAQQKTVVGRSSTSRRKFKPQTVAAKFQQSLLDLMERMERCNPFFVRCIKPNNKKEPGLFETEIVSSQLRYSGILETIRIRKVGFPVRIPFQIFLDRYRCLVDIRPDIIPDGWNCVGVLKKLCPVTPEMYCIGATKLFMKESIYQILESKRERMVHMAVVTLQRYTRGFLIKKRFYALRHKIILLQARARGFLVRQRYRRLRRTLIKVRCLVRIYVNRRRYLKGRQRSSL